MYFKSIVFMKTNDDFYSNIYTVYLLLSIICNYVYVSMMHEQRT